MALIKSENVETNKYQVEISVDAKTFNDACERSYKKNVKKINVPGFRRGKAPRKMIERMYGESIFYDDAIEMVYPSALSDAIKEAELDVVGVEKLEPGEISTEKGLTFTATCIVKPDIELEGYKGLKITHTVHTVSAADVNKELKQMQERNGREITVDDRPVKKNDTVVFDFDGMIDGKRFEGGKAERHTLQVGSGMFIPGFEDQIVGKKIGEPFDVTVTFPEDYHEESLKGKEAVFHCLIHEIKVTELPTIDDEFAKDVSEFDTLKELKADIRARLKKYNQEMEDIDEENQLTNAVVALVKGDIPEVMYEQRIDELVREFEYRLSAQGMNLEAYAKYMGQNRDAIRAQFKDQAERQVKLRLALEKIAKLEKIEPTADEIADEFAKMAEKYQMEKEQVEKLVSPEDLKQDLATRDAMAFLKKHAEIEEIKPEPKKPAAKKTGAKKTTSAKKAETAGQDQEGQPAAGDE